MMEFRGSRARAWRRGIGCLTFAVLILGIVTVLWRAIRDIAPGHNPPLGPFAGVFLVTAGFLAWQLFEIRKILRARLSISKAGFRIQDREIPVADVRYHFLHEDMQGDPHWTLVTENGSFTVPDHFDAPLDEIFVALQRIIPVESLDEFEQREKDAWSAEDRHEQDQGTKIVWVGGILAFMSVLFGGVLAFAGRKAPDLPMFDMMSWLAISLVGLGLYSLVKWPLRRVEHRVLVTPDFFIQRGVTPRVLWTNSIRDIYRLVVKAPFLALETKNDEVVKLVGHDLEDPIRKITGISLPADEVYFEEAIRIIGLSQCRGAWKLQNPKLTRIVRRGVPRWVRSEIEELV